VVEQCLHLHRAQRRRVADTNTYRYGRRFTHADADANRDGYHSSESNTDTNPDAHSNSKVDRNTNTNVHTNCHANEYSHQWTGSHDQSRARIDVWFFNRHIQMDSWQRDSICVNARNQSEGTRSLFIRTNDLIVSYRDRSSDRRPDNLRHALLEGEQ